MSNEIPTTCKREPIHHAYTHKPTILEILGGGGVVLAVVSMAIVGAVIALRDPTQAGVVFGFFSMCVIPILQGYLSWRNSHSVRSAMEKQTRDINEKIDDTKPTGL